jgi:glycosyl transferase family 25
MSTNLTPNIPNIPKIFYINLDKRTDRRELIENELKQYNLYDKAERIPAIHTPDQGILGCTMSHLAAIKLAKERNYDQVLILEDDFYFTLPPEEFENLLAQFYSSPPDFQVCMISYNMIRSEPTNHSFLLKVLEAQTASGYIVHQSLYDPLIQVFEEAIPLLRDTKEHWNYANDQIWKRLQPNSNWFAIHPRCGKQRDGFSDNANQHISYDC